MSNTILDDRLILHTLPNWFFGENHDGDILDERNIRSLVIYCQKLYDTGGAPQIQMVTGDGSIDCLDNPECQEEYVSKLHTSEFITALALLADGGSLLLKFFTFYETTTVSMLYVLNCCFDKVHLFKPASSKEGNSEVYVIGIGYHREMISDELIERLICNFKISQASMLPLKLIPQDFLDQVSEAAKFFMNLQVSVIESNIKSFRRFDKFEVQRLKGLKNLTVQYYMKLYKMRPIAEHQKLLHGIEIFNDINLNVRVHLGSHAERISFYNLSRKDQINVFYNRLQYLHDLISSQAPLHNTISIVTNQTPKKFLKPIRGKPIERVMSSKFILANVMKYFIELRAYMEQYEILEWISTSEHRIEKGGIAVDFNCLLMAKNYDVFEKSVIKFILGEMLNQGSEEFIIKDLLMLTQCMVGVLIYLGCFVYNDIKFEINSGKIKFSSLKSDGISSIKFLLKEFEYQNMIGICDTKFLFTCNTELYRSLIDYNNKLCLKYCSTFLNFITRD